MNSIFTEQEKQYIYSNYKTMSYKEIAEHLGFTERQIRGHINNAGLTKLTKKDVDYFDIIDIPEKAYWLGFMYADGYVEYHKEYRNYEASMELQDNDKYALERLNLVTCYNGKITHREKDKVFNGYSFHTSSNVIRFYSKRMYEDLIKHGVVPNKTFSACYPENLYFPDAFVRGYLDGDGCIYINKDGKPLVSFVNANEAFLLYLSQIISKECGAIENIYMETERKYRLMYFTSSSTLLLLNWIYHENDCFRLERKYEKYKSLVGLAA